MVDSLAGRELLLIPSAYRDSAGTVRPRLEVNSERSDATRSYWLSETCRASQSSLREVTVVSGWP